MTNRNWVVGVFVVAGLVLFTIGIYMVGDRHQVFAKHLEYYAEFKDLAGLSQGAKVRVGGMDAGEVVAIGVPDFPAMRFCVKEGWVFPSPRSKSGHLNSIAVGFRSLRTRTGVSSKVVPYSARHTYGSFTVEATGNIFAVADSMGHVDVQSMKPYQHHSLDSLRDVIDRRNDESALRHVLRHVPKKGK